MSETAILYSALAILGLPLLSYVVTFFFGRSVYSRSRRVQDLFGAISSRAARVRRDVHRVSVRRSLRKPVMIPR